MALYSPVPNNSPLCLLRFGFFLDTSFLFGHPPQPQIEFPDFVLQIFQRVLKWIVLFLKTVISLVQTV